MFGLAPAIGIPVLFVLSVIGLLIYLIPAFVAEKREHENKLLIAIVTFFTGWTLIGWVACLIWSLRD
jgi:hypothetical protein